MKRILEKILISTILLSGSQISQASSEDISIAKCKKIAALITVPLAVSVAVFGVTTPAAVHLGGCYTDDCSQPDVYFNPGRPECGDNNYLSYGNYRIGPLGIYHFYSFWLHGLNYENRQCSAPAQYIEPGENCPVDSSSWTYSDDNFRFISEGGENGTCIEKLDRAFYKCLQLHYVEGVDPEEYVESGANLPMGFKTCFRNAYAGAGAGAVAAWALSFGLMYKYMGEEGEASSGIKGES